MDQAIKELDARLSSVILNEFPHGSLSVTHVVLTRMLVRCVINSSDPLDTGDRRCSQVDLGRDDQGRRH